MAPSSTSGTVVPRSRRVWLARSRRILERGLLAVGVGSRRGQGQGGRQGQVVPSPGGGHPVAVARRPGGDERAGRGVEQAIVDPRAHGLGRCTYRQAGGTQPAQQHAALGHVQYRLGPLGRCCAGGHPVQGGSDVGWPGAVDIGQGGKQRDDTRGVLAAQSAAQQGLQVGQAGPAGQRYGKGARKASLE